MPRLSILKVSIRQIKAARALLAGTGAIGNSSRRVGSDDKAAGGSRRPLGRPRRDRNQNSLRIGGRRRRVHRRERGRPWSTPPEAARSQRPQIGACVGGTGPCVSGLRSCRRRLISSVTTPSGTIEGCRRGPPVRLRRISRATGERGPPRVPHKASSVRAANEKATMTTANDLAVCRTLETAGIEFIDENGGGPGVRLRRRQQKEGGPSQGSAVIRDRSLHKLAGIRSATDFWLSRLFAAVKPANTA